MKVVIFGATGKAGRRVTAECIAQGHQLSLVVRNLRKLDRIPNDLLNLTRIIQADSLDAHGVAAAMRGHDAAVQAAGSLRQGEKQARISQLFITQAEKHLAAPQRCWLFGTLSLLAIPQTSFTGLDLPFTPKSWRVQRDTLARLHDSPLDWSIICPGAMVNANGGPKCDELKLSLDILPFGLMPAARAMPRWALALMMRHHKAKAVVTYEDVAAIIAGNLEGGSRFSRHCVGVARPPKQLVAQPH